MAIEAGAKNGIFPVDEKTKPTNKAVLKTMKLLQQTVTLSINGP